MLVSKIVVWLHCECDCVSIVPDSADLITRCLMLDMSALI